MLHSKENIVRAGTALQDAERVLMMIHGRGASARDILSLAAYFDIGRTHLIAPQATNHSWYPYSFLAPVKDNEPWLSSALELLKSLRDETIAAGKRSEQLFILGFSQGACLTLEFASRNAEKYGGIVGFTGGLIGDLVNPRHYSGDFGGTKVFIGNSDIDPHVPLHRSEETRDVMTSLGAAVTLKVYKDMGHTINQDELDVVDTVILNPPSIREK